jgi:hypothetical protein
MRGDDQRLRKNPKAIRDRLDSTVNRFGGSVTQLATREHSGAKAR